MSLLFRLRADLRGVIVSTRSALSRVDSATLVTTGVGGVSAGAGINDIYNVKAGAGASAGAVGVGFFS